MYEPKLTIGVLPTRRSFLDIQTAAAEKERVMKIIRQIHPEGLGRNKQIVADLIRRRQYFALSMLYGLKNRKG